MYIPKLTHCTYKISHMSPTDRDKSFLWCPIMFQHIRTQTITKHRLLKNKTKMFHQVHICRALTQDRALNTTSIALVVNCRGGSCTDFQECRYFVKISRSVVQVYPMCQTLVFSNSHICVHMYKLLIQNTFIIRIKKVFSLRVNVFQILRCVTNIFKMLSSEIIATINEVVLVWLSKRASVLI